MEYVRDDNGKNEPQVLKQLIIFFDHIHNPRMDRWMSKDVARKSFFRSKADKTGWVFVFVIQT